MNATIKATGARWTWTCWETWSRVIPCATDTTNASWSEALEGLADHQKRGHQIMKPKTKTHRGKARKGLGMAREGRCHHSVLRERVSDGG